MSKSEVNLTKKFSITKLTSETALPSQKSSINRERKLNNVRCQSKNETIDAAEFKPKKVKPTNLYICKLVYPRENKYPSCDHQNDFVIDRNSFDKEKYLKFLAQPKKFYEKPHPKWVRKNIPPCTVHLNKLSQPRKLNLITTLNEHRHHFSFSQIENLIKRLNFGDHQTPREVMQTIMQQLSDSNYKIRQQKCEIKKLKLKIAKSKQFEDVSSQIISKLRQLVQCDRPMDMTDECKQLADSILPKICQMTGHKVPNKNSTNTNDKAHIKLTDKLAVCIYDYIKSNSNRCQHNQLESDCLKRFKNMCIPIDSYYPQELTKSEFEIEHEEKSLESHDGTDDDDVDDEEEFIDDIKIASSEKMTAKRSFLRPSQINVTVEECQEVMGAINDELRKSTQQKAEKDVKRAARAEREAVLAKEKAEKEAERKAQEKAEAKAKKRARRRKGRGLCFGNMNPMPQWQVEFKETVQSEFCKPSTSNSP